MLGWHIHKAKNTKNCQQLPEVKRDEVDFSWNLRGTTDLISDFWSARFLKDVFIVLIHPVCDNLLHQP